MKAVGRAYRAVLGFLLSSDSLLLLCGVIPVLYLSGFGRGWYREPKILALWTGGVVAGAQLLKRIVHRQTIILAPAHWILLLLPVAYIPSLFSITNAGLALQSGLNLIATSVVAIALFQRPFPLHSLRRVLLPAALFIVVGMEFRAYFGLRLIHEGNGLGMAVGERNSASVLLALLYPLFLSALAKPMARRPLLAWWLFGAALIQCVLLTRTRSAWWMLVCYGVALLAGRFFGTPERRKIFRRVGIVFGTQLLVAICVLQLVPSQLSWLSSRPYWDSFVTMASPGEASGRVELWQIGLSMWRDHWLGGVGLGNYVVMMRDYVARAGVDPMTLGFLRNDLPLFQDYLQSFVEGGVVAGFLFALLVLGVPISILLRLVRAEQFRFDQFAVVLAGAALSVDAFFDYPFQRPETMVLFVAFMTLGASSGASWRWSRNVVQKRRVLAAMLLSVLILVASMAIVGFGGSHSLRRLQSRLDPLQAWTIAWKLWPWDGGWDERALHVFLKNNRPDLAESYVKSRQRNWPSDPATFLSTTIWLESEGQHQRAKEVFVRAQEQVPGGRCIPNAWLRLGPYRSPAFEGDCPTRPEPLRVLLYHQLTSSGRGRQYVMPIHTFERQMIHLAAQGYRTILPSEYLSYVQGQGRLPERSIMLTFDDWSWEQFALVRPILKRLKFRGTFFVVTQDVAEPHQQEQLRTLVAEGHEVGSHTVHHYFLSQAPCDKEWKCCHEYQPCRPDQIRRELRESKSHLEAVLDIPITSFAWPGNFFTPSLIPEAVQAGYTTIFAVERQTVEEGVLTNRIGITTSPSTIYRTEIGGRCPMSAFRKAVRDGRCCVVSDRKFYRHCVPQSS